KHLAVEVQQVFFVFLVGQEGAFLPFDRHTARLAFRSVVLSDGHRVIIPDMDGAAPKHPAKLFKGRNESSIFSTRRARSLSGRGVRRRAPYWTSRLALTPDPGVV